MHQKNHCRSAPIAARLAVYVQPRASKTHLAGEHDSAIKVRLAAPPVDGAANAALIEFIAKRIGVSRSDVRIVSGHTSRRKVIEIDGLTLEQAQARLASNE